MRGDIRQLRSDWLHNPHTYAHTVSHSATHTHTHTLTFGGPMLPNVS